MIIDEEFGEFLGFSMIIDEEFGELLFSMFCCVTLWYYMSK